MSVQFEAGNRYASMIFGLKPRSVSEQNWQHSWAVAAAQMRLQNAGLVHVYGPQMTGTLGGFMLTNIGPATGYYQLEPYMTQVIVEVYRTDQAKILLSKINYFAQKVPLFIYVACSIHHYDDFIKYANNSPKFLTVSYVMEEVGNKALRQLHLKFMLETKVSSKESGLALIREVRSTGFVENALGFIGV